MRFLVTGANGFLGSWLTRALVDMGDDVRCLVRAGSDVGLLEGAGGVLVHGDVTQPSSLPAALDGVDVCYHLAGVRRGATRDDFLRVNAEGTRHVADAMVQAGARRLVFCGSLAASGPSVGGRPREEADPFSPEEWYGESKALGEGIAFGYRQKLEVTAIRPGRIIGPGDHENLMFFKLVKRGLVLRFLGAPRRYSMVDVDDVVQQCLLQGTRPEAVGEAFFCASDETTTVEALMRLVAEALNQRTRTVPVPEPALRALAAGADLVSRATGKHLPLSRKLARQLLAPGWTCSIEKAKAKLGYRPTRTLREAIFRSAEAYLAAGWL